MQGYLSNRKQRTKINTARGSWKEILFGVQGFILGPRLFQYFCVICYKLQIYYQVDFASYADDNTQNVIGNGVKEAINSLKEASDNYFTGLQTIK